MKKLTDFINETINANTVDEELNLLVEGLLNEPQNADKIDEGLFGDLFKKISGKFSKAKNSVKAAAAVANDWVDEIKNAYNEKLAAITAEEDAKKRAQFIEDFKKNAADAGWDKDQIAQAVLALEVTNVKLANAAGDTAAEQAATEQVKKDAAENKDAAKKVQDGLNKAGEGEGDGAQPAQTPEVVDQIADKTKNLAQATGADAEAVTNAVKKFLGIAVEEALHNPKSVIEEGNQSEAAKKYFTSEEDKDGKRLLALTTMLTAWQGLAKQLNVPCEKLLPLVQAILANKDVLAELNK